MGDKIKFILIGLVGLLLISFFITFQVFNAKQTIGRERDSLKRENESLAAKINAGLQDNRRLQEKFNNLNKDVERSAQDRSELEKKYELLLKEKDELTAELKAKASEEAARPQVLTALSAETDDAYWAAILKEKTDLEIRLENIRKDFKEMQIKNEELQRGKASLELELKNQMRDKQDLKRQMDYNQKMMDSVAQELVRERNDKFQIQDSIKSIKNDNYILRRQLKSLGNRKIVLEKKLAELQGTNTSLENSFGEMEQLLKDRMAQIENLRRQLEPAGAAGYVPAPKTEESVELPPIFVRPQGEPAIGAGAGVATTLDGKVLAVKRDNNFVIIDLGQGTGIKVGDSLQVYRQSQLIADIEVIQVRPNIAACDIKREATPIQIGDNVR